MCVPVGPLGVRAATAQLLIALVRARELDLVIMHAGHLVPARNKCWADAVRYGVERVLWLDADIFAPQEELAAFLRRADDAFAATTAPPPLDAWIGAVCARRGGGWAMQASDDAAHYPLLMGLGLAYWDTARMRQVLGEQAELAFRWLPPFGEDYDCAARVWDAGFRVSVDALLPTEHDDVGTWPGAGANR